jgi:CBS domain-containing protein
MTRRPISCKPDHTLREVLSLMKKYKFRRIPVLEKGKIVGEITLKIIIAVFRKTTAFDGGICPDPIRK